jgi:TRAP-type transport system periplasmic protein
MKQSSESAGRARRGGHRAIGVGIILVALLVLVAVPAMAGDAPKKTIRLAHALNEESAYHQGALEFARAVERLSNGQLRVDLFPNAQLGNDRAQTEALQLGTIDCTSMSTATMAGTVPPLQVVDLPTIFKDAQHVDRVFDGPIGEELASLFAGTGIKVLSWWEIGFRQLTNSRKAVRVPEDVRGLKIRTLTNPIMQQAWRLLGAQPTPLDFQEVYSALQAGVVDGQENPLNIIGTAKLYEVQKYISFTSLFYSASPFLVSDILWSKLSADERKIVTEAAKLSAKRERQAARGLDEQWLKTVESKGMQIERNPEREKFAAMMTPIHAEYAKKYGAQGAKLLELLRASR